MRQLGKELDNAQSWELKKSVEPGTSGLGKRLGGNRTGFRVRNETKHMLLKAVPKDAASG